MHGRNVSLDTLRSAAIIFVVNCHIASLFTPDGRLSVVQLGGRGVDLFFVLSGWLLGHYLLSELKESVTIELRRFWLRRWLRTLPAYYAMLAFTLAWQLHREQPEPFHWQYLVFAQNYMAHMPYFTISWSLCVEEHFYLAVAPLILLFSRSPRARLLAVPLVLAPAVCRLLGWYGSTEQTHVRYDQCAAGVLLAAVAVYRPVWWRGLCRAAPVLALAGLAATAVNVEERLRDGGRDLQTSAWTLIFSAFVLLANSNDFWRRRARVPGCRFVAERSYALYLVHVEALVVVARLLNYLHVTFLPLAFVLTWGISFLLAEILYRGIERPFMRSRERFSASRSLHAAAPAPAREVAAPTPTVSESVGGVVEALPNASSP
jgi:peptidoglycan/LPS O-acetylase OafA/YrhL